MQTVVAVAVAVAVVVWSAVCSGALTWLAAAILYIVVEEIRGGYSAGLPRSGWDWIPLLLACVVGSAAGWKAATPFVDRREKDAREL